MRRVGRGVRRQQALAAIRRFEASSQRWGPPELARAIGISPAQAGAIVRFLLADGVLVRGRRVVTLPDVPTLARPA